MVLVKRNKSENNKIQKSENVGKKLTFSDIELKTYKEESIEVLDILDKQGVNIYDENRYGGMYLKSKNNINNSSILKNIFSKEDKEKSESNNLNNLFNHFNNSK